LEENAGLSRYERFISIYAVNGGSGSTPAISDLISRATRKKIKLGGGTVIEININIIRSFNHPVNP